ncbi:MAG: fibronectin type III domain-containing protein [Patescibacteria group bacterium]
MKKMITSMKFWGVSATLAVVIFPMVSWAAIVVSPASAGSISETGASLTAHIDNPWKTTTVWFEWGETPELGSVAGMSSIWHQGFSSGYLSGLKPGTKYYYRAVATEGGERKESSVASFTTPAEPVPVVKVAPTPAPAPKAEPVAEKVVAQKPAPKSTKDITTKTVAKAETSTSSIVWRDNSSMASVFGIGEGIFPDTLVGWVALIITLMAIVLIVRMIFDSVEKRGHVNAREDKEGKEGEVEKHPHALEVPRPPKA